MRDRRPAGQAVLGLRLRPSQKKEVVSRPGDPVPLGSLQSPLETGRLCEHT